MVETFADAIAKSPGLQGPIDDVFMKPFLVVLPGNRGQHVAVDRWVKFESQHFVERWLALMRGAPRVKIDSEVTAEDFQKYNLILWGDPQSNSVLRRMLSGATPNKLPLSWDAKSVSIGDHTVAADHHAPVMIYPNPFNARRYVAINAGLTFREEQDRTNSLQNPRLPDWAIIDLNQAPTGVEPGRVAAAGFFSESW